MGFGNWFGGKDKDTSKNDKSTDREDNICEHEDDILWLVMCYMEQLAGATKDRSILHVMVNRNVSDLLKPRSKEILDGIKERGARSVIEGLVAEYKKLGIM
jgi:hypothetical protein